MSTFEQIEAAVADKRVSYKELVEAMCANTSNAERMAKIFANVVLPEDDPKVLRKKYRDEQVEQHGDDKAAIKEALVAYDKEHKPKTKRVPPPPRVWTDEDKAKIKAKNAYVKAKEREQGDDVTVAELKTLRKGLAARSSAWLSQSRKTSKSWASCLTTRAPDSRRLSLETTHLKSPRHLKLQRHLKLRVV